MKMRLLLCLCGALTLSTAAASDPLKQIDNFLQLTTFKAAFVQKVYSEDKELLESSEGYVLIHRPGRFMWRYDTPDIYIISNNGLKFTAYDPTLSQAHISRTLETLSTAPLMVLLSRNNVFQSFYVNVKKPRAGLSWLRLTPKVKDGEFQYFDIGFSKHSLKKMVLLDHFKQRIEVTFSGIKTNIPIPEKHFVLDFPEGTDIIDHYTR